jgi:hypothetical protein
MMSHVVEVRRIGDDIAGPMGEMRTWLDVHQIEPRLFTFSAAARGVVFCLEFEVDGAAKAFATVFGGRVLGDMRPRAA